MPVAYVLLAVLKYTDNLPEVSHKAVTRIYFRGVFGGRDSEAHRDEARGLNGCGEGGVLGRRWPAPSPPAIGPGGAL